MTTDYASSSAKWKFLSRWCLLGAVVNASLMAGFISTNQPPQKSGMPQEFGQLAAAVAKPGAFRVVIACDVLAWLVIGTFLVVLGTLLVTRAPIRGAIIGACGIGQATGLVGAFMRLTFLPHFAAGFAAADAAKKAALMPAFLDFQAIMGGAFNASSLLFSIAFLTIASSCWSLAGFPRWIAVVIAIPGVIEILKDVAQLATGADLSFVVALEILLIIVTYIGFAVSFWRGDRVAAS